MIANGKDLLIGLYINEKELRVVTSNGATDQPRIANLYAGVLDYALNIDSVKNRELIPEFSRQLEERLSKNVAIGGKINLAIDKSLVLIKKAAIDQDLTEAEIRDHVEWELEQFLITSRDYYNVGFEMGTRLEKGLQEIIIVCARLSLVDYLKDIFSQTPYQLSGLDVSIFSAQRAVKALHGEQLDGLCLLMIFEKDLIELLLMDHGNIVGWCDLSRSADEANFVENPDIKLVDILKEEIFLSAPLLSEKKINRIFVDGDINAKLVPNISVSAQDAHVVRVDLSQTIDTEQNFQAGPASFLVAMGMNVPQ